MPVVARFIGLMLIAIVVVVGAVQAFQMAFLSVPPLFFESAYGDIYVAGALLAVGCLLCKLGQAASARRGN